MTKMKNKHVKSLEELNENKNLNISDVSDRYTVKEFLKFVRNLSDEDFEKIDLEIFDCYKKDNIDINYIEPWGSNNYIFEIIINDD